MVGARGIVKVRGMVGWEGYSEGQRDGGVRGV